MTSTTKFCTVLVKGHSMWPTLSDGEEVECELRAYDDAPPRVGDIVLCTHPLNSRVKVVKRVSEMTQNGKVLVEGDNPDPTASTDSHAFGPVPMDLILGRIVTVADY